MEKRYSVKLAEFMQSYLESKKWDYSFYEKDGLFHFSEAMEDEDKSVNFIGGVWDDAYFFFARFDIDYDSNNKEIAEYILRVNDINSYGSMSVDYEDNRIICWSLLNCNNMEPSYEAISDCLVGIYNIFEKYEDGLLEVAGGKCTAEEAFDKAYKQGKPQETPSLEDEFGFDD